MSSIEGYNITPTTFAAEDFADVEFTLGTLTEKQDIGLAINAYDGTVLVKASIKN